MSDFFAKLSEIGKETPGKKEEIPPTAQEKSVEAPPSTQEKNVEAPPAEPEKVVETPHSEPPKEEPTAFDAGFFTVKQPEIKADNSDNNNGIETPESFFDKIATQYGFSVKSFDDALGLMGKLKETEAKVEEYDVKTSNYENLLATIPEDIKMVMMDAFEGKNYHDTMRQITGSQINYTKPAESYKKETLIQMYNSDITTEELEDMDEKSVDRLYNLSVKQYNAERKEVSDRAAAFDIKQKESAKLVLTSIDNSINKLKEKYPEIKKTYVDDIRKKMKTNYAAELLNEQNVWKEDAAIKIAMAEYGSVLMDNLRKQLETEMAKNVKLAKSEAREEVIKEKLNDAPPKDTHSSETKSLKEMLKAQMPFLSKKK